MSAYAGRMTLFDQAADDALEANAPLAAQMRPRTLDEVVGQDHLLAAGSPLRRLVEGDAPMSLILYGPPGSGKTTLARIVSSATNRHFVQLSALNAGVKDVRAVIDEARRELGFSGTPTVLFIDEIHRFSKTQQDSLLAAVEGRLITLVAATTENPFFSMVSPLLSRSLLLPSSRSATTPSPCSSTAPSSTNVGCAVLSPSTTTPACISCECRTGTLVGR